MHTCVVDEADMLLDGGFVADVQRILDFLTPVLSNTRKRRVLASNKERLAEGVSEGELFREARAEDLRPPAQVVFAAATLPDWKGDKVCHPRAVSAVTENGPWLAISCQSGLRNRLRPRRLAHPASHRCGVWCGRS